MERLSLRPDDSVYALADDHVEGALLIVPVERVTEWQRLGRAQEAAERERIEHDG
ncbi:Hypothetical protein ERS075584_05143 [Mycobacteroides abscessus]|nr:Hypothetical protein ERS075584_05143 [Mycobacteroides abscessus]